jgi:hypothetical protein
MVPMERDEYFRRLFAAYDVMDDRARRQQLRQFERAAADHPREVAPVVVSLARVVPIRRSAGQ